MADVLFVTGEYPPDPGGVGDYTAQLRATLARQGTPSRVLTRARPGGPALSDVLREIPTWDGRALARIASRAAPRGIVHFQFQPAAFDLRGEICLAPWWLRLRRPDVRTVTTFHDARVPYLFPGAGPLRLVAIRLLARTSQAVIAADPTDLRRLGGAPARQHLIAIGSNIACAPPAGYDRAAFRQGLGLSPGDPLIAYFGFLNTSKGLETLLDAFERLRSAEPGARLLLLGGAASVSDATDRQTAARLQARLSPVGPAVIAPGWLPEPDLSAHLLAADVALLPYGDGASMRRGSLLACVAHGLPIVTTTGPGLLPPLPGNVRACLPGSAEALAGAVLDVVRNPAERARLKAGSAAIGAVTTWDEIATRHAQIYAL